MQSRGLSDLIFRTKSFCRSLIGGSAALALLLLAGSGASCERDTKLTIAGEIPEGFAQIYPERGEAPALIEGERYYVRVVTSEANGDGKYFIIRDGKVEGAYRLTPASTKTSFSPPLAFSR